MYTPIYKQLLGQYFIYPRLHIHLFYDFDVVYIYIPVWDMQQVSSVFNNSFAHLANSEKGLLQYADNVTNLA